MSPTDATTVGCYNSNEEFQRLTFQIYRFYPRALFVTIEAIMNIVQERIFLFANEDDFLLLNAKLCK
jgi:hypothetical protein